VSALAWERLAQLLIEALTKKLEAADRMRTKTAPDGKTIMPSFDELAGESFDDRAFAVELLTLACKADRRIGDALSVACANAKGVDHDILREVVSLLPSK
jgi:hypothetical protein